ncbi:hypothetical protein ABL78_8585 [Leptomonas seymouri]|uniref:Uncharacterized protein n=1 Tax=Leptomonas seymouri TaxID=5684 RepID=A0A0N1HY26_LEPSE|nr:hypothetical protein ABL78_8585 [Leptomonas seymouri]|eukprot:KPI82405.1 hypothetical protein ABL78_8585 [Leptomonas seymouri]
MVAARNEKECSGYSDDEGNNKNENGNAVTRSPTIHASVLSKVHWEQRFINPLRGAYPGSCGRQLLLQLFSSTAASAALIRLRCIPRGDHVSSAHIIVPEQLLEAPLTPRPSNDTTAQRRRRPRQYQQPHHACAEVVRHHAV